MQVVIAAKRASQQLEITSAVVEHNHETTKEMYNSYPECRRLDEDEKAFVTPLLDMKVRPSMILQRLNEKTGDYSSLCSCSKELHFFIQFIFVTACRQGSHCQGPPQLQAREKQR